MRNGQRIEQGRFGQVKIAVFTPMPSASDATAIAVNPGLLRSVRTL